MKQSFKKCLSLLLAGIMVFGALPFAAFAESENVTTDSDVTLTATNTVGKLMTEAFDDVSAQGDSYISEIVFEKDTATVTFAVSKSAKLVVAVYDDETKQMLDSEVVTVSTTDTEKSVSFDVSLPDVFLIKAFLLDGNNNALCDAYARRVDPEAYEDFMSKTTDDFEAESVINLDNSKTNNFLVLADGVESVSASDSVNVLQSVTGDTYVFTNINAAFKALKNGDIFYLDNGDVNELTVIKIKSISVNGNTATVVADEAAADEMFEFIKIGSETKDADFTVEELGEGVSVEDDVNAQAWDGGDTTTKGKNFPFENTFKNSKGDSIKVSGGANFKFDLSYKYYISKKYSEVSFSVAPSVTLTLDVKGDLTERRYKLGKFTASLYGANISITPTLVFSASAQINLKGVWSATIGVQYDTTNGVTNKSVAPSFKPTVNISGQFYVGFDMAPSLNLISDGILSMDFTTEIGITIKASYSNESEHLCENCIDGDINWSAKIYFNLYILKHLDDTLFDFAYVNIKDKEVWSVSGKLTDFYHSFDNSKFGWGECPNKTIDVPFENGDLVEFGSYPQTLVTDNDLLFELNSLPIPWISYGYYSGDGNYGSMKQSNYMKYADIIYNGQKYRAVLFTSYRPWSTYSYGEGYQRKNGYDTNKIYWFKYEPLKWRVLDGSEGLVICQEVIDSQPFTNTIYLGNDGEFYKDSACTVYCSNYAESDIREWLNDDFYNTAFTSSEKNTVRYTTLDNRATVGGYSKYDSASTTDKIFLLSSDEARYTKYFENNNARRAWSSDYARCQGLYAYGRESICWYLRSAGSFSLDACGMQNSGNVSQFDTSGTIFGIRPAITLDLSHINTLGESVVTVQAEAETVAASGESIGYEFENCVSGKKYIVMNVADYSESFTLTEDNLCYINEVTADENGIVSGSFLPKTYSADSMTLLFGNFKPCEIKITNAPTQMDYKTSCRLGLQTENSTGDEKIVWKSSNEKVLKVDANGDVAAVGRGTATVTATVDGTDISDSVTVTVKYTWWQWIIVILLFGWIWY